MWEKEREELLQDYRYRKNILHEITLDDIEKWNNMDVDVDWDKITNKPSTFPPSTHTHNFEDLLEKPTTLEGYGITDVYTKDEIQDNTLNKFKAINGKVLVDTGFNLGLKDGDNLISYNYGISGAPTLKLGVNAYISSYMSNMDIVAPTQLMLKTDNLNLKTKLFNLQGNYGSFDVDVSDNKANNKLYASIPAEFADIVKAPRLNIYSGNNTVLEGALWNSTYNVNGSIKDGLHLSHENGKYLALAYKNASTGIYNSYMILDVEGVLKNDSDGDDWGPVRFEQSVFFRHGLKIGGGEDITLAGKGVNTRITALENAITQGTGMVEWNNVLNKPSTFPPSTHNHDSSYLKLSGGTMDSNAELTFANAKGLYGKDSKGVAQRLVVIGADDSFYSGGVNLHTYIRSKDCPQYLDPNGNKYDIYHAGNFNPEDYLPLSGGTLTGDITLSNSKAIKGKNNSGTAQDLIKLGTYATSSGSTQATIVGNSTYPTISLGSLYEGNYRVLNSNNFTNYCPSTSDLDNYLPLSGGLITDNVDFANGKGIHGKDSKGTNQRMIVVGADDCCYLGGINIHTYVRSSDCPQYLDAKGNKYDIYHSGYSDPVILNKAANNTEVNNLSVKPGIYTLVKRDNFIPGYGAYFNVLNMGCFSDGGGYYRTQLAMPYQNNQENNIFIRKGYNDGTTASTNKWSSWERMAKASDLNNYALIGHSHMQISSQGRKAPMTGRNAISGIYCYSTSGGDSTGSIMPSGYCVVIGFGDGTGGSAEIAISYTGNGMWYRYLRDYQDNWSSWKQIK